MYIHTYKADCVCVGRKILDAKGKSRSITFVQREKRSFQKARNGVFPSVAIFAGQLKRSQLYIYMASASCELPAASTRRMRIAFPALRSVLTATHSWKMVVFFFQF
jgi:hypothetical protein